MKYFNCHTHTFNMQYVPENFLRLQTSPHLAHALHWILGKSWMANPLLWLSKFMVKGEKAKTVAFITIGLKKTQDMIFADLCSNYPKEDEVKYIVFPLDFTHMGAGKVTIPYRQQLDDLFDLKLKYPDKCYPFVAIDPRSGSADANKTFVEHYINKGFSGIKLYPALGFFAFDKGLEKVYEYAQENYIPLMTHCSSGGINYAEENAPVSFINPDPFYRLSNKEYFFPQSGIYSKMKVYCDQFNNPENFREALERFPCLKICFAHFGLNSANKFGPRRTSNDAPFLEWFNIMLTLMEKYPNVYTDISYSIAYKGFCKWFKQQYDTWEETIQRRIMFGTDYYMTVMEEHGTDAEMLQVAKQEFGIKMFLKISNDNVIDFLGKEGVALKDFVRNQVNERLQVVTQKVI